MIPKAELASPFLPPSCPTQHLFCKILLDWSCLIAPQGNSSPYCPHLGELSTVVLFSPSTLSMTLGTKMAPSRSQLVPARKSSACQAPARHRRTSQSAREVLPSQSQISHLIINHPGRARRAPRTRAKLAVLSHRTCAPRGGPGEAGADPGPRSQTRWQMCRASPRSPPCLADAGLSGKALNGFC